MEKVTILNTKNFFVKYFVDENCNPTIVIFPGGGYKYTSLRESECIARKYNEHGFNTVVINYREEQNKYSELIDLVAYVIDYLHKDIHVSKIIGLGFSAGGHLLGMVGLDSKRITNYNCKLDLLMFCYPVVTTNENYWHKNSFINLLGEEFSNKELLRKISLENMVTSSSPDAFLWHTLTDESVSVENSILLFEAYRRNNANIEIHIFPYGGHGMSLATLETAEGDLKKVSPYINRWVKLSIDWLKEKLK